MSYPRSSLYYSHQSYGYSYSFKVSLPPFQKHCYNPHKFGDVLFSGRVLMIHMDMKIWWMIWKSYFPIMIWRMWKSIYMQSVGSKEKLKIGAGEITLRFKVIRRCVWCIKWESESLGFESPTLIFSLVSIFSTNLRLIYPQSIYPSFSPFRPVSSCFIKRKCICGSTTSIREIHAILWIAKNIWAT